MLLVMHIDGDIHRLSDAYPGTFGGVTKVGSEDALAGARGGGSPIDAGENFKKLSLKNDGIKISYKIHISVVRGLCLRIMRIFLRLCWKRP